MNKVTSILAGLCILAAGGAAGIHALAKKRAESLDCHLGNAKDFKKYQSLMSEDTDGNVVFGTFQGNPFGLSLDSVKTNRSTNVLTIGGSDSERKDYIKYNIMQENSSAVVVSTNQELFLELAPNLIARGYPVYWLNLSDFMVSSHYNPLQYLYYANGEINEIQVDIFADLLSKQIQKEGKQDDPFRDWHKQFIVALLYYVLESKHIPESEKCLNTVLKKAQMETGEENSPLSMEIETWIRETKENPQSYAIRAKAFYEAYQSSKNRAETALDVVSALQIFAREEVDSITRTDKRSPDKNIDFDKILSRQGYLFVTAPKGNRDYDFLLSVFFSQFYSAAYEGGEKTYRGKYYVGYRKGTSVNGSFDTEEEAKKYCRQDMIVWSGDEYAGKDPALPVHVNIFLDDFTNLGELKNFTIVLATCRKYRIGNHCIINSLEELEKVYPDGEHESLRANIDTILYFGGENVKKSDAEFVKCYLEKIALYYQCKKISSEGYNINYTPTIQSPLSIEEILAIGKDNTDEIIMARNWHPFICQKCKPENHKRYKEYHDASKMFRYVNTSYHKIFK